MLFLPPLVVSLGVLFTLGPCNFPPAWGDFHCAAASYIRFCLSLNKWHSAFSSHGWPMSLVCSFNFQTLAWLMNSTVAWTQALQLQIWELLDDLKRLCMRCHIIGTMWGLLVICSNRHHKNDTEHPDFLLILSIYLMYGPRPLFFIQCGQEKPKVGHSCTTISSADLFKHFHLQTDFLKIKQLQTAELWQPEYF